MTLTVMRALQAEGVQTVIWLTLRDPAHVYRPANKNIFVEPKEWPDLVVADWNNYSANHPEWFVADGIAYSEIARPWLAFQGEGRPWSLRAVGACPTSSASMRFAFRRATGSTIASRERSWRDGRGTLSGRPLQQPPCPRPGDSSRWDRPKVRRNGAAGQRTTPFSRAGNRDDLRGRCGAAPGHPHDRRFPHNRRTDDLQRDVSRGTPAPSRSAALAESASRDDALAYGRALGSFDRHSVARPGLLPRRRPSGAAVTRERPAALTTPRGRNRQARSEHRPRGE